MSASIDTQLVTIDRAYFDTLVRRANFNREDILKSSDVSISRSEYDGLKQIAAKYANLRQNLERGGVDGATIDLLSKDDATLGQQTATSTPATAESNIDTTASYTPQSPCSRVPAPRRVFNDSGSHEHKEQHKTPAHVHSPVDEDADDYSVSGGGPVGSFQTQAYNGHAPMRPHYERQCARSILLSKLPDNTTHADITDAVRGGQLLDIYLRSNDRTAAVSFLLAADAKAFYDHVKRHDLYINHKRVEIRWNDRQFILPGHVASKVGIGATRNLVIRRCDPRFTEQGIKDDLEHIHNLVVIKVEFIGGSCYIKTNSVHNAIKYKGSKIDWDVDECNQPFATTAQPKARQQTPTNSRTNGGAMTNRFNLLNIDDDGDALTSPDFGTAKKTMLAA
ncbi:hypothetical protein INS49_006453 [Diaporthe citri]|uniref:uncharacterized protein n=1 Tax=Diaporthe citri TaxID=83186 RepID=UPI001C817442|nr:uncharacterized protein INS49_006453 [Diaporthe citri]KAG6364849.1 hypothetical protein INS49_006453 [Diaporthe citri]